MKLDIYQVDAFTDKLFSGNPAAVVPLNEWLPDVHLQNIAKENNLSETAFFVKVGGIYELRWFTPIVEVDLCGHATLAAAKILFDMLHYDRETLYFQTKSGTIKVSIGEYGYELDFPTDKLHEVAHPKNIEKILGVNPEVCFQGRTDYMFVFNSEQQIREMKPNMDKLKKLGGRGVIVTARGDDYDFVSRFFAPAAGIDEDPVTGSAHTSMTQYWVAKLGKKRLSACQVSDRTGHLTCSIDEDRTILAGSAVIYMQGSIEI